MSQATFLKPTSETFQQEVLSAPGTVLVDFWASWCGPCRALKPTVEYVAGERADSLQVAFVDVDENPELASSHGIQSIPALRLFKDGELVASLQGSQSKTDLEAWLDANG